ncbi:MAG: QueT transporter family protein [Clostridiales bacterium]|jgi:uncharacterized membrane protein|nr:QueT transporter family protein [Clostridiales bacterium]
MKNKSKYGGIFTQTGNLTKRIAISGVIAALYVVLTLGLAPISFEAVQFRISEILNLMAFIDPLYGAGVILGCFIANSFSPFGLPDIIFGTLATAVAIFAITRTKSLFIASLWPMFANVIVAIELTYILHTPIWYNIITVWIGEFVVVTCVGYPLFRIIMRDRRIMKALRLHADSRNNTIR